MVVFDKREFANCELIGDVPYAQLFEFMDRIFFKVMNDPTEYPRAYDVLTGEEMVFMNPNTKVKILDSCITIRG